MGYYLINPQKGIRFTTVLSKFEAAEYQNLYTQIRLLYQLSMQGSKYPKNIHRSHSLRNQDTTEKSLYIEPCSLCDSATPFKAGGNTMKIQESQAWVKGHSQLLQHSMIGSICTCYTGNVCSASSCVDCQTETHTAHLAHVA